MKKLLLLLLLPFTVFAQSFETQVGSVMSNAEIKARFQVSTSRNKLRYGTRLGGYSLFDLQTGQSYKGYGYRPKEGFEIGEFKDFIHLTSTRIITTETSLKDNPEVIILGLLSMNDESYVLFTVNDYSNSQERVYVNHIRKMDMMDKPTLLATYEKKKGFDTRLFFTVSPDNKTFIAVREFLDKPFSVRAEVKVFNSGFGEIYNTSIDLEKLQNFFQLNDIVISNDQNLYFYGVVNPRGKKVVIFERDGERAFPLLLAYNAKNKETVRIEVAEPGVEEYYDHRLFMTREGEVVTISCYKAKPGEAGYTISHINNTTLSRDWKQANVLSKASRRATKPFTVYQIELEVVDFEKLNSGDYVFSLEVNYFNRGFAYSEPVVLIGIDAKGAQLWENVVYKRSKLKQEFYAYDSHRLVATKSGLLVVYNDLAHNLRTPADGAKVHTFRQMSKAVPVAVEVDGKGNMKKASLLDPKKWKGYTLDMTNLVEIDPRQYQFRIAKSRGKYRTAYGKINMK